MSGTTVGLEKSKISAVVLANAAEIVSGVVSAIAGNDISSRINDSRVTRGVIHSLVMQRINKKIEAKLKQS